MGPERFAEGLGSRWFGGLARASSSAKRRLNAPVGLALAAATVVLGALAVLSAGSWTRAALYSLASAAVVALTWGFRALVGGTKIVHRASVPAVGLGLACIPLGLTFAPVPGVRPTPGAGASARVLWSASLVAACVAVVFGLLAAITGAPAVRVVTVSAVALLGAMMLPFSPFDGVWLRQASGAPDRSRVRCRKPRDRHALAVGCRIGRAL